MDYLWQIHYDYSWGGLLTKIMGLGLLYILLYVARWLLRRITSPAAWQQRLHTIVEQILLVFEPLAILILSSYFVLIKPFYHGLIMLLLMLTNFRHLCNYFSGTILRFDPAIRVSNRLRSNDITGVITEIGRLGIRLQDNSGIHFQDYDLLWKQGYSLLNSEESGRFYRLKITTTEDFATPNPHNRLQQLLHTSPYINWQHQPRLSLVKDKEQNYQVNLALHDEKHLAEFMERLEEDHFSCQIAKL